MNDIVSVADVDIVMESSHDPRSAVAGPFKFWIFGWGKGRNGAFIRNAGETIEACWEDSGTIFLKGTSNFPHGQLYSSKLNQVGVE